jgi:uncharacterized protein (TIGR02145 family)
MKKLILFSLFLLGSIALWGQSVTLTFTGQDQNGNHVQLDRVVIANLTRNWQETIAFPDTVYTLSIGVGVENYMLKEEMKVMPNPFDGATRVNLSAPANEQALLTIVDMQGRIFARYNTELAAGDNYFNISLSTPQMYILTVQTPTRRQSLKMVNTGHGGSDRIMFTGSTYNPRTLQLKGTSTHDFLPGDYMRYIGYANISNITRQSAVIAQPQSYDEALSMEFFAADAVPCPGMPTIADHEGNVYHTVQIGSQCWTRENMRCVTSPTTGTYLITPEGTPYTATGKQAHWMLGDSATYAPLGYGVLYNWNAAVDTFNTTYGELHVDTTRIHPVWAFFKGHRRGICPEGWHVPSYNEWYELKKYVSSQSEYLCSNPDDPNDYYSPYLAKSLAAQTGWRDTTITCDPGNDLGANNATGFSALPAGWYYTYYADMFSTAVFWSSSRASLSSPVAMQLNSSWEIGRVRPWYDPDNCFSVRCLRDYALEEEEPVEEEHGTPCPDMPTVADHEGNVYHTVQIGSQCWTKENMRCETSPRTGQRFINDSFAYISHGYSYTEDGAYWPNHDSASNVGNELGLLYSWAVALDTIGSEGEWCADTNGHYRGICPEGWHIPSRYEWLALYNYFASHPELTCNGNGVSNAKALAAQTGWMRINGTCSVGSNPSTNNATGFTIRPTSYGSYQDICIFNYAHFLSNAYNFCAKLWTTDTDLYLETLLYPPARNSVRCLRNE